jgi:hypothetical protein
MSGAWVSPGEGGKASVMRNGNSPEWRLRKMEHDSGLKKIEKSHAGRWRKG